MESDRPSESNLSPIFAQNQSEICPEHSPCHKRCSKTNCFSFSKCSFSSPIYLVKKKPQVQSLWLSCLCCAFRVFSSSRVQLHALLVLPKRVGTFGGSKRKVCWDPSLQGDSVNCLPGNINCCQRAECRKAGFSQVSHCREFPQVSPGLSLGFNHHVPRPLQVTARPEMNLCNQLLWLRRSQGDLSHL